MIDVLVRISNHKKIYLYLLYKEKKDKKSNLPLRTIREFSFFFFLEGGGGGLT